MSAVETPTPFAILFTGRTGSTFLTEALDSHPLVRSEYELFAAWRDKDYSGADQVEAARRYFAEEAEGLAAVGFKTKLADVLDPDGFRELLREVEALIVVLRRRNLPKQVVSLFNAQRIHERTGDWNLYECGPESDDPLEIPTEDFVARLHRFERQDRELLAYVEELMRPTLTLFYEDLVRDATDTIALAFRFLGVDPVESTGLTVKATPDDLRSILSNVDELEAELRGTRWESMLSAVARAEVEA